MAKSQKPEQWFGVVEVESFWGGTHDVIIHKIFDCTLTEYRPEVYRLVFSASMVHNSWAISAQRAGMFLEQQTIDLNVKDSVTKKITVNGEVIYERGKMAITPAYQAIQKAKLRKGDEIVIARRDLDGLQKSTKIQENKVFGLDADMMNLTTSLRTLEEAGLKYEEGDDSEEA